MTADKIEPCPVCGYRVALDKDGALPYNHPPVFKCCGYSTTDSAEWNSYARERKAGMQNLADAEKYRKIVQIVNGIDGWKHSSRAAILQISHIIKEAAGE